MAVISEWLSCDIASILFRSGKFDYDLYKAQSPINCVCWHPDDSLVVTGAWDAAIRIFDVYNKVRKAVSRRHV